jgi:hypothetical protein
MEEDPLFFGNETRFSEDSRPFLQALSDSIAGIEDLPAYQVKLEAELDRVELRLMEEVSQQSSVFAMALSIIEDLQSELADLSTVTGQISTHLSPWARSLKADLDALDDLVREQEAVVATRRALQVIEEVVKAKGRIEELINATQFDEAVEAIAAVEQRVEGAELKEFEPLAPILHEFGEMRLALQKLKLANEEMQGNVE